MAVFTTVASAGGTGDAVRRRIEGRTLDVAGAVFKALLWLALAVTLVLGTLLVDVVTEGWSVLAERFAGFLTGTLRSLPEEAGIAQGLWGTFWIGVFVVVLAFPLGIGAAVYLEEYAARTRFARFVDVNTRILAGAPSVVYGILGFAIFVESLGGSPAVGRWSRPGVTPAVLVLPLVITTSADALRAVPDDIRETGFGSVRPGARSSATTCCPTPHRFSSRGRSSRGSHSPADRRPPTDLVDACALAGVASPEGLVAAIRRATPEDADTVMAHLAGRAQDGSYIAARTLLQLLLPGACRLAARWWALGQTEERAAAAVAVVYNRIRRYPLDRRTGADRGECPAGRQPGPRTRRAPRRRRAPAHSTRRAPPPPGGTARAPSPRRPMSSARSSRTPSTPVSSRPTGPSSSSPPTSKATTAVHRTADRNAGPDAAVARRAAEAALMAGTAA